MRQTITIFKRNTGIASTYFFNPNLLEAHNCAHLQALPEISVAEMHTGKDASPLGPPSEFTLHVVQLTASAMLSYSAPLLPLTQVLDSLPRTSAHADVPLNSAAIGKSDSFPARGSRRTGPCCSKLSAIPGGKPTSNTANTMEWNKIEARQRGRQFLQALCSWRYLPVHRIL